MLYLITDTHLGHRGMCRTCGRPVNFSEMICHYWRDMVRPDDTVIHLGDVAWNDDWLRRVKRLPGHKILVRGNHDKKSDEAYRDAGFETVVTSLRRDFGPVSVLFTHEPCYDTDLTHPKIIWNIHGHNHDLHREEMRQFRLPLSLEHMGYRPIAVDASFLDRLEQWGNDRHLPTLPEIMSLGQDKLGTVRPRDLWGALTPDESCRGIDITGADGTIHIDGKNVVCHQFAHDTLFVVVRGENIRSEHLCGDLAYADLHIGGETCTYWFSPQDAVSERYKEYSLLWLYRSE